MKKQSTPLVVWCMLNKIDEMFEEFLADMDALLSARTLGEFFHTLGYQMGRDMRRIFRGA